MIEQIHTTVDQTGGFHLIRLHQLGVGHLSQRGELGPGADRSGNETRPAILGHELVDASPWPTSHRRRRSRRTGPASPYSPRGMPKAPKVLVSITSTPTRRNERCSSRTTSGRVTLSNSLQPSRNGTAEVVGGEADGLKVGPGGAIENDHTGGDGVKIRRHRSASMWLQQGSSVGLNGAPSLSLETPRERQEPEPYGNSSFQALAPCFRRLPRYHRA